MWFQSYLKDRQQYTSFKVILSERSTVKSGVPLGSILGLLLFILFINDMPLHTEGDMDMYADDSTLSTVGKNINELEDTLNHDLQNVDKWCKNNRMLINVQKTKAMIMTTWQKRLALNERREMNVFLNNEKIQSVECEKLLGVIVNQDVSWEPHIVKTLKTVNRLLGVLWRIKKYLPLKTRKLFYTSFILPHMDYCSSIWGGSPHIKKLFLYQKRAARVILDVNIRHHSSRDLFISLNWMPIKDRIEYQKIILVYKARNGETPGYISDMFSTVSETHGRETRAAIRNDLYVVAGRHKEVYRQSFAYSGALIWNQLNTFIREAPSLEIFKSRYLQSFFDNM